MATAVIDVGGPKGLRIFNDIDMAHVWGTMQIPVGAVYPTGGFSITWRVAGFPSSFNPYFVLFYTAGSTLSYVYQWNKAARTMQIFTFTTGAELAAGAVPAGVSSDTIEFEAIVQRA